MAPVELVGLTRGEGERQRREPSRWPAGASKSWRSGGRHHSRPRSRAPPQRLEDPGQRQPLPRRLPRIGRQHPVELVAPGPELGCRLDAAGVAEGGCLRADHLPDDLAGELQLPADLLDRLMLHEVRAADLRDRLHDQHPPRASRFECGRQSG